MLIHCDKTTVFVGYFIPKEPKVITSLHIACCLLQYQVKLHMMLKWTHILYHMRQLKNASAHFQLPHDKKYVFTSASCEVYTHILYHMRQLKNASAHFQEKASCLSTSSQNSEILQWNAFETKCLWQKSHFVFTRIL